MEVTLGGERLGSGGKQKVEMHNYMMNSFNLEQSWKSSAAPGVLYPFVKEVATNHGTFDIDVDSLIRTLPTKGPLFGTFKAQFDFFIVPFRLYQGILHNNPQDIGLDMNKVYLPKLRIGTIDGVDAPRPAGSTDYDYISHYTSLTRYLGFGGIGTKSQMTSLGQVYRKINAVPYIAYYDIFKCYYANKQEEYAYVITPGTANAEYNINGFSIRRYDDVSIEYAAKATNTEGKYEIFMQESNNPNEGDLTKAFYLYIHLNQTIKNIPQTGIGEIEITLFNTNNNSSYTSTLYSLISGAENATLNYKITNNGKTIELFFSKILIEDVYENEYSAGSFGVNSKIEVQGKQTIFYQADIELKPFKLKNIDKMRYSLLSRNELEYEFKIGKSNTNCDWDETSGEDQTGLPYSALIQQTDKATEGDQQGITWNAFTMNGLVVKTYQSDLYNNWLRSSFVDVITARTAVDTSNGSFTMDTLILTEKLYELLNRILVGGGTYQDWQEACYGEGALKTCETPIYVGGMSAEVGFDEVISNAETNVDGNKQALGTIGGRGREIGQKGGKNIHCKFDEPGYLIGIFSLTPRVCYSQGNDWDLTELETLDDLHKPGMDGIGFQNLMIENFAWWNTVIKTGTDEVLNRYSAGKQTAWINYQTAVDKCYGDFAKQDGYSFMVLNRNYERQDPLSGQLRNGVKDITTYIDPAKYNYAFAYNKLDAQNFWVQIYCKVIARRKMGAQQLPNL